MTKIEAFFPTVLNGNWLIDVNSGDYQNYEDKIVEQKIWREKCIFIVLVISKIRKLTCMMHSNTKGQGQFQILVFNRRC